MLNAGQFDTDKSQEMLNNYERWFGHLKDKRIALLELGVYKGGSLLLWNDYFSKGTIVGLDTDPIKVDKKYKRIKFYKGYQEDLPLLDKIARQTAPDGFDIIIDDASHIGRLTKISYNHLFNNHLKSGGIYIIEDWGTGYWPLYPDGKHYSLSKYKIVDRITPNRLRSHDYGMVGFMKQIIDELGMDDITAPNLGISPQRPSSIARMEIYRGQAAIFKA